MIMCSLVSKARWAVRKVNVAPDVAHRFLRAFGARPVVSMARTMLCDFGFI